MGMGMGYDNSINSQFGGDGYGPPRPFSSRCDDDNTFKQIGSRQRIRRQFVRRIVPASSLLHCQRECIESKDFICRSFNYRDMAMLYDSNDASAAAAAAVAQAAAAPGNGAGREREREVTNCELSDRDTRELDLQNPTMFDTSSFDYYERSNARSGADSECLDGECWCCKCASLKCKHTHIYIAQNICLFACLLFVAAAICAGTIVLLLF